MDISVRGTVILPIFEPHPPHPHTTLPILTPPSSSSHPTLTLSLPILTPHPPHPHTPPSPSHHTLPILTPHPPHPPTTSTPSGVAKLLLRFGANINTHSVEFKESALTLSCYKGHLGMVRFLLGAGADQEHKTDEMHTALMEASMVSGCVLCRSGCVL